AHYLTEQELHDFGLAGAVIGDCFRISGDGLSRRFDDRLAILKLRKPQLIDNCGRVAAALEHLVEHLLRRGAADLCSFNEAHEGAELLRPNLCLANVHASGVKKLTAVPE